MPDGASRPTQQQKDSNAADKASEPASRLPPLSLAPPLAMTSSDLRELVLDYLSHSCFVDTAQSFVQEWDRLEGSSSGSTAAGSSNGATSASTSAPSTLAAGGHSSNNGTASAMYIQDDDDDGVDDHMMQSIHQEERNGASSMYSSAHEQLLDGDDTEPYQDRRHPLPASRYLSNEAAEQIRARRDIKRLVQQGSIQAAIDLCNTHFPSVLSSYPMPFSKAPARTPSAALTLQFRQDQHLTTGLSPTVRALLQINRFPSPGSPSTPTVRYCNGLIAKNVPIQPYLLSLSLQIQLFIEVVRSAAPPPPGASAPLAHSSSISRPSTPLHNANSPESANGSMDGSTASLASNTSQGSKMSVLSNGSSSSTSAISQALSQAQSLHAQAGSISDPTTKAAYLKELEAVSGLLPYRDPRTSPMAYYLDEKRRDVLADALNGAILLSLGKTSTNSKLENLVKQNEEVWNNLMDLKATFPPEKGANKNTPPKPIYAFNMQDFLDATLSDGSVA